MAYAERGPIPVRINYLNPTTVDRGSDGRLRAGHSRRRNPSNFRAAFIPLVYCDLVSFNRGRRICVWRGFRYPTNHEGRPCSMLREFLTCAHRIQKETIRSWSKRSVLIPMVSNLHSKVLGYRLMIHQERFSVLPTISFTLPPRFVSKVQGAMTSRDLTHSHNHVYRHLAYSTPL